MKSPQILLGDVNQNGSAYEVADAALFALYFTERDTAFDSVGLFDAVAATDVNQDGIPIAVEDFVYLTHVINGNALPINQLSHDQDTINAIWDQSSGLVSIDRVISAGLFVFDRRANIQLLAPNVSVAARVYGNFLQAFVYSLDGTTIPAGDIFQTDWNFFHLLAADVLSNRYYSTKQPPKTPLELGDSFPNPFNPMARIPYSLPWPMRFTILIQNSEGSILQKVDSSLPRGVYRHEWTADPEIPTGTYYYTLIAGEYSERKSMLLAR